VYLDVDSVDVKTSYHAQEGLSIIDSHVDCANLVPSFLEPITIKLATRSHRFIAVLSGHFSHLHMEHRGRVILSA